MPAVDRQGQRAPHPGVVERLFLVVRLHQAAAVPVAFLDRDLVAERPDDFVTRRGRQSTKLHRRAVAADCLDPHRLLVGINAGEAVEMGQALMVIVGVLDTLDRLPDLIFREFERARAENIFFVPARVQVEDFLLVDPTVRIGQRRQKRARCKFQMKDHGHRAGRLDRVDHLVMAHARAQDALRRMNDMLPAGGHVRCRER